MWNCLCECGGTSVVDASSLTKGYTHSCGCLRYIAAQAANVTHGMTKTPLYRRWAAMKQRCDNRKVINYDIYGGRGVKYDPRWVDFNAFFEDMNQGFEESLEIDRIDVNGDYSKDNCRWVTHSENNFNKTIQSNNISGKTGVSLSKTSGKYRAYISVDGKYMHLGLYDTKEEAVESRRAGEIKYYGYNRP